MVKSPCVGVVPMMRLRDASEIGVAMGNINNLSNNLYEINDTDHSNLAFRSCYEK